MTRLLLDAQVWIISFNKYKVVNRQQAWFFNFIQPDRVSSYLVTFDANMRAIKTLGVS